MPTQRYSRDYWLVRGELIWNQWQVPTISSDLGAMSAFVEGSYKVSPGFFVAGRIDRLGFGELRSSLGNATWDAPVTRLETGIGYYLRRNFLGKGHVPAQLARRRTRSQAWPGGPAAAFLAVMKPFFIRWSWTGLKACGTTVLRAVPVLTCALLVAQGFSPARAINAQGAMGVVRGRVEVRRAQPQVERRPNVNDLGMHAGHDAPDLRRSVVYLESAPSLAFPDVEPQRATMDQRNETFVPHVLAITVGTTVDFPNSDNTYHNVFSLRGPKPFDLGRYPAGRSKSVRFDRPGIVRVFCEIHSHMSAFILVFNHRYFAVTAADGRYQIGRVPAGRYTLVAWNEGAIRESRPIVISDDGAAVEADFSLR